MMRNSSEYMKKYNSVKITNQAIPRFLHVSSSVLIELFIPQIHVGFDRLIDEPQYEHLYFFCGLCL
jgi:hypothetical protein